MMPPIKQEGCSIISTVSWSLLYSNTYVLLLADPRRSYISMKLERNAPLGTKKKLFIETMRLP